ncbi:hypothetical protein AX17_006852 [Amanita inopinata Kibby_2008]|nr:hypothetical protein AX17_006852 [Amanita inopinata Kibby_2008]
MVEGCCGSGRERSFSAPYAERLKAVKDRQKAWRRLDWRKMETVEVSGMCTAYELVGGVFAKTSGRDLFFSWLPSARSEGRVIHHQDVGLQLRDFAIDPTQDLIVMLQEDNTPTLTDLSRTVWLHLRTMSSLKHHPKAQTPDLQFRIHYPESQNHITSAFLQIAEDVLAVFISMGFLTIRVILWHWKDGRIISDTEEGGYRMPRASWDFALISPRSFIVTSILGSGAILLYRFSYPEKTHPVHVATLRLPEIQNNRFVVFLSSHSGPFLANPPEGTVFTTSPDSRIQVISVGYRSAHAPVANAHCFFYVHNHILERYVQRYEQLEADRGGRPMEPIDVPWEDWGLEHSRFYITRTPSHWLRYVQGERVVCPPAYHGGRGIMEVWDFHVSGDEIESVDPKRRLMIEPSTVTATQLFKKPIRTMLPYHSTMRVIGDDYGAFVIDEERVIGLKVDSANREDIVGLDVYIF